MNTLERYDLQPGDALLVTDVQNDFHPGNGQRAVEEMIVLGAKCISLQKLAA